MQPTIISAYDEGRNNRDLMQAVMRLDADQGWKNMSCVMLRATGTEPHQQPHPLIFAAWENLVTFPNAKFVKFWSFDCEVGAGYSNMVSAVLGHPELRNWKYIITLEHDNSPPRDGIVRLLRQMEAHPELHAISGLYFTKGEGGCAQIWGDPTKVPWGFEPQLPDPHGGLKECCGLGMGFCAFRISMFKDKRLRQPWFVTKADAEGQGTQDLYFWGDARQYGYRCAVDCSIKVGHYDRDSRIMW